MSTGDIVDILKDCKQNSSIIKLRMKMLEEVVEAAITSTGSVDKKDEFLKKILRIGSIG